MTRWMVSLLLVSGAGQAQAAESCAVASATAKAFKPVPGPAKWQAGGWDSARLAGANEEAVAEAKQHKKTFASYNTDDQKLVLRGTVGAGLDEVATAIAWGEPSWSWSGLEDGCRHLLFTELGPLDVLVSACQGEIVQMHEVTAPIDCERLDAVVPRIEADRERFDRFELDAAVAVLAGVPGRWMGPDDLIMAFGKPTKRFSAGGRLTYADDDGRTEGPTVSLVDSMAVSWDFPQSTARDRAAKATTSGELARSRHKQLSAVRSAGGATVLQLQSSYTLHRPGSSDQVAESPEAVTHESYRNHQRLECNGAVLYDRVFTNKSSCQASAAARQFDCNGQTLRIRC